MSHFQYEWLGNLIFNSDQVLSDHIQCPSHELMPLIMADRYRRTFHRFEFYFETCSPNYPKNGEEGKKIKNIATPALYLVI